MGNRAIVVFEDSDRDLSPAVYLHWHGHNVIAFIEELRSLMTGRDDDIAYASARFVGIAHSYIEGNLSLGMWNLPINARDWTPKEWASQSHGDEGLFKVNVKTWRVQNINLGDDKWTTVKLTHKKAA